jgi:hypothetical protein
MSVSVGKHAVRVEDPVTGQADAAIVDVKADGEERLSLTLKTLNDDERASMLQLESSVQMAIPRRPRPASAPATDFSADDDPLLPVPPEALPLPPLDDGRDPADDNSPDGATR